MQRYLRRLNLVLLCVVFARAPSARADEGWDNKIDVALQAKAAKAPRGLAPAAGGAAAPLGSTRIFLMLREGADPGALMRAVPGLTIQTRAGRRMTATVPLAGLSLLAASPDVVAVAAPQYGTPKLEVARSRITAAGPLYLGIFQDDPATFGSDGTGVIVGVVDTGIDWRHADFKDAFGFSRILSIWDQNDAGGPLPPGGFGYGTYWTKADIDATTPREVDMNGHGTHVAGIAAGNGRGTNGVEPVGKYSGVAPKADIVFVATDFSSTGVCDGINYIIQRAAAAGKRAVINMSIGFAFGGHDGQDWLDTVCVDPAVNSSNVLVVVAAGNEAQLNTHAQHTFTGSNESLTFSAVNSNGGNLATGTAYVLEFWGPSGDGYDVSVSLPGYGNLSTVANGTTVSGVAVGATALAWVSASIGQGPGRKRTYVEIDTGGGAQAPSIQVTLKRVQSSGSGAIDGYVDDRWLAFASDISQAGTIAVPASGNAVMAVASYNTKNCWQNVDSFSKCYSFPETIGAISSFSSLGPTRDGRRKPDIAAPGQGISSTLSAQTAPDPHFTSRRDKIMRDDRHIVNQGTSMASPMVAGAAALVLQTFPSLTAAQVKARLIADARGDGAVIAGNTWGAGKLAIALKPKLAPTGLTATANSQTQITFTWAGVPDAATYDQYDGISQTVLENPGVSSPFVFNTTPNTLKGLFLRGRNQAGSGPGVGTPFAATLASAYPGAGQGAPSVASFVTSMTVTYSTCGGISGGCNGFQVEASPNVGFTGPIFMSSTSNNGVLSLPIVGLTASAQYWVRVANLNQLGVPSFSAPYGPFTQNNAILVPDPAPFSAIGPNQIQQNWLSGGNAFGTYYRAKIFSDAGGVPGPQVGSDQGGINVFSTLYTGLSPGTTYWFSVTPQQGAVTGGSRQEGPQATQAGVPAVAGSPLISPSPTSVQASWLANGNGGATIYEVDVSASPTFATGVTTQRTYATALVVGGQTPNSVYYARVRGISFDGAPTAWVSLGSARTLAAPPVPLKFDLPFNFGFQAFYSNGGNAPGATFRVGISRSPSFNLSDDQTYDVGGALSQQFSDLLPATQYYFHGAAYNSLGVLGAFSGAISTFTLSALPATASPSALARTTTSLRLAWSAGLNPPGPSYLAEIHANADFSDLPLQTVVPIVPNLFADFNVGLSPNSVYYARVRTLGMGGQPPTSWVPIPPASTLTAPLGAAATLVDVKYTSATFTWTPIPACSGYMVEASTDSLFRGTLYSNTTPGAAASRGGVAGLPPNTLLYFRVGPVNVDGASNPTNVAAPVTTLNQNTVSQRTTSSGASLSIAPLLPPFTQAAVDVPPGALPDGTTVTLNTSVEFALPIPRTNEATLIGLGAAAGVEVSAQGQQPSLPVRLSLAYNPASLPPGLDPNTLQVARWDDAAGQWTLLPTTVDTLARTLRAQLNHFSLFGVFGVKPASALDAVQLFPSPWEINSQDPRFSATALTLSNLPANARVRMFSASGELVWDNTAGAGGVLTWRGVNRYGGNAGSGTYIVVIEGGGGRVVKRAVIIR